VNKKDEEIPMIFLAKLGVGVMGTALIGAAALSSEGFIHVKVHENRVGGTRVNLIVPAALVSATLKFIPDKHLAEASRELRPYLPVIDAAIPALEDCPDGVLVEVIDEDDHVRVKKDGGSLVVDVNEPDNVAHVSVPLRAAQSALDEITAANGFD
jgi:hypothetical protein